MKKNKHPIIQHIICLAITMIALILSFTYLYSVITEDVTFVSNKIMRGFLQTSVASGLLWFVILIYVIIFHIVEFNYDKQIETLNDKISSYVTTIENLNKKINENKIYDSSNDTWNKDMFDEYISELYVRGASCYVIKVHCDTDESLNRMMMRYDFLKEGHILLFDFTNKDYVFMFIETQRDEAMAFMDIFLSKDIHVIKSVSCSGQSMPLNRLREELDY